MPEDGSQKTDVTNKFTTADKTESVEKTHPKGHLILMSMFYGFLIALAIGLALNYFFHSYLIIDAALPIGLLIGALVGRKIEKRLDKVGRIRPITKEERKIEQFFIVFGLMLFIISLFVFIVVLPQLKK